MNNTKWRELQTAMYELSDHSPQWRTKCIDNAYVSSWDGEWYYHFSDGGYKDIEWAEIKIENEDQKNLVLSRLKAIHVPGHEIENGYKVYGYIDEGQTIDYI